MGKGDENPQIVVSSANNGSDKKPLTSGDEEEGERKEVTGDPIPEKIQATICLIAIVAGILLVQGIFSSEWVFSVSGYYWQGLFVYCTGRSFNETGDASGELKSSEELEDGCSRIDLENQAYTMFVAFLCAVSLSTNIFSTTLVLLGLWVRDLDSKIKSFRLAFYLMVLSLITLSLGLIIYRIGFGETVEEGDLGPFKYTAEPEESKSESSSSESESDESSEVEGWDWEFGWSYNACCVASFMIFVAAGLIGYALCIMPVPEEEEEEEE